MFDAKSLFDILARGANQGQSSPAGGGGLGGIGDILGQLGQAMGQPPRGGSAAGGSGAPGGLEDILRNMFPDNGAQTRRPAAPEIDQRTQSPESPGAPASGGLADILGKLQEQLGGAGRPGSGGGGLIDILGQVLGQATQGVKEGAQRVDDATGASGYGRDVISRTTGKSPEEIFSQLKDLIANNPVGAGAAAGGLGTILLGTRTGRSITASALKLGGLALIGGLAYKALQNYQQGRPLISDGQQVSLTEAPNGSGFETDAISNDAALLYIRAMIAAAAADGRIDADEQERIIRGLKQAGLDAEAEEFLASELNNPASIDDLIKGVTSEEEAVQLFTAARVSIDLDNQEEHDFLVALARGLQLDDKLVSHIDSAARAVATPA